MDATDYYKKFNDMIMMGFVDEMVGSDNVEALVRIAAGEVPACQAG